MGVNEEENVQKEAFEDFIFGSVKCIWRCNFCVCVCVGCGGHPAALFGMMVRRKCFSHTIVQLCEFLGEKCWVSWCGEGERGTSCQQTHFLANLSGWWGDPLLSSKVMLFSLGLMRGKWMHVTQLADWWGPEAGRFNEGLCSSPGLCSRKAAALKLPRAEAMPHPQDIDDAPWGGK